MKKLITFLAAMLFTGVCFAEIFDVGTSTSYFRVNDSGAATASGGFVGDITGDVTGDVTGNVTGDVTGDVTGSVTGNVTGDVTGDLTGNVTGDVTGDVAGIVAETVTASTATNGEAITLTAGINTITPQGGANDTTNTCTVADVAAADVGKSYTVVLAGGVTNLLGLADSGNLKLSAAFVGDEYDVVKLLAIATNVLVEVERSDN